MNDHPLSAPSLNVADELLVRDQLVQQLSEELYQLMVQHPELFVRFYQARKAEAANAEALQRLQQQIQDVEARIATYQEQILAYQQQAQERESEVTALKQQVIELGDRNQMLERVIQEMPEVYRQKFSERLKQVQLKVEHLQKENDQLRSELRHMQALLPAQSRQQQHGLPSLQPARVSLIPSFGNA
ncbi:hypothetical protein L5470_03015 [Synechococcus sp. PCC 6717]|nr:hypothetical protein [Synechococcus sp. PCC 6717]